MLFLDQIAEQKIAEAAARGELDDLPGAGRPLDLDDDALIPEDARTAYRILRNAGFIPAELQSLREIADLERLLESGIDMAPAARAQALKKLHLLQIAREETAARGGALRTRGYLDKIMRRLG